MNAIIAVEIALSHPVWKLLLGTVPCGQYYKGIDRALLGK